MNNQVCPRCYSAVRGPGECAHCKLDVPVQWLEYRQISLAMTGARTAGKSVLIAVMMDQFSQFVQSKYFSFLEPLGTTADRLRDTYTDPLYVQRRLLQPTPRFEQATLEPLMWTFAKDNVPYCLAITDAAGEHFQDLQPTDYRFAYLGHVDLLVSLIDPTKVPSIAAILDGLAPIPRDSGDDLEVLRKVLAARTAHRGNTDRPQYLGLTLSKFDLLQHLRFVEVEPWRSIMAQPGSAMRRDPSLSSAGDEVADGDLLQAELQGLLEKMHAESLTYALNGPSAIPYRLFATSALGMAPTAEMVGRGGITPYRVLDLLKAAIAFKEAS